MTRFGNSSYKRHFLTPRTRWSINYHSNFLSKHWLYPYRLPQIFFFTWKADSVENLQSSLANSSVFAHLSQAIVLPFVKQPKSDVNSYRPIALTDSTCKLLEKILNRRVRWYLEKEGFHVRAIFDSTDPQHRPSRVRNIHSIHKQAESVSDFFLNRESVRHDLEG